MAKYLMVIILLSASLTLSSCAEISTPNQIVNETTPTREVVTASFTSSPTVPPLTPSNTTVPVIPTNTPLPLTPTLTPAPASPFHFVSSLAGLPVESTGDVEVYAPADGSVWIITGQAALRWDDQAWEVVHDMSEGELAAVDDGGLLWVLPQDTREISAWQDGQWTTYTADSGWVSVGQFEQSWWATTPWGVYTDANGTLWVPLEREVRVFDGNNWNGYTLEDMGFPVPDLEEISIVHYLAPLKGIPEVWVGECYYSGPGPMGGGGVRWFNGEAWQGEDSPVGSGCVSATDVDDQEDVWLGVSDSIWQYDHTSQFWTENGLPKTLLSDFNFTHPIQLIVDQAGDVWVIEQMCGGASCDGPVNLYQIHAGEWSLVIDSEYRSSSFKQLVLDGNGQGWLFWEGMFYRFDGETLELITAIDARGVDVSSDGSIWVVAGSGEEASLQVLEP
jgi:hypothetical protein